MVAGTPPPTRPGRCDPARGWRPAGMPATPAPDQWSQPLPSRIGRIDGLSRPSGGRYHLWAGDPRLEETAPREPTADKPATHAERPPPGPASATTPSRAAIVTGHSRPATTRPADNLRALARAWSQALAGAVHLPLTPAQQQHALEGMAHRLATAAHAEPFDPAPARQVGHDLVSAGFHAPATLGRSITVLTTRLARDLQLPDIPATAARVTELIEALVCGYTTTVHNHTLAAQEAIRAAAMAAQARTEQALWDSQARLRHYATHDPVTGLPGRTLLSKRLTALATASGPDTTVAVCCLDIDRFAAINDSLGHRAADRLLTAIADRLRTRAAPAGWLVARLESDQFAILAETRSHEDPGKLADQALSTFAEPFQVDEVELSVTAAAGVADSATAGSNPAGLIRAAQVAMRWGKTDSQARWNQYSHDRAAADEQRYQLSAAIPRGLRRGEFTLAYQPLVDLTSGQLVGLEALARWRHPQHGLLPARRFIDLAECTGMIVPLGNDLLAQACQHATSWRHPAGQAPYVSVNVAAAQIAQPGFAGYVTQLLDHTGLPPHRLQLELTEHARIGADQRPPALDALTRLGVRIAIDDFGTGYANLDRLSHLAAHAVKLDTTLTQHAPANHAGHDEVLTTIVALGHILGHTVIAEGIETAAHTQRMRDAGCDIGQGWHLGRPVLAHQLPRDLPTTWPTP